MIRAATIAAACAVLAAILTGCGVIGPTPKASESAICGGVPADIGCDDPPTYVGTTCAELAGEWGREVNARSLVVMAGPKVVDEERHSVRLQRVMVFATTTMGLHMGEVGLLGVCSAADIFTGAQAELGPEFRSGIRSTLFDNLPPSSWEDFTAVAMHVLSVLDFPSRT